MVPSITAAEFRDRFERDDEFAVVDTREIAAFFRGHMLAASNLPLSRLEIDAPRAIPRRGTRIVLTDWSSADAAAEVLRDLGYRDLEVVAGGLAGWHLAGGRVFPGWNVIGKSFGDYIEKTRGTPTIESAELKAMIDSDDPPYVIDTRTPQEHSEYCIPGAVSCPNGEMLLRVPEYIRDPRRLVVTHCAGRTRGIMGAQALIEARLPNRVVSLANGTLEWALAGLELEVGANRPLPLPSDPSGPQRVARELQARHGIRTLDAATLRRWQGEAEARTLCLLDVRSAGEFAQGTWPGARHAPGGQILQNADAWLVVRGARYVLLDSDGVRATRTAAWIRQMGYRDVSVFELDARDAVVPPVPAPPGGLQAATLKSMWDAGGCTIADVRSGVAYRSRHVRGSWFLGRSNLPSDAHRLPADQTIVLLSDEPAFAALVARDLDRLGRSTLACHASLDDLAAAGIALESGTGLLASEPHDAIYDLEEREVHVRDAHDYLKWRVNLFEILGGDPAAPYLQAGTTS